MPAGIQTFAARNFATPFLSFTAAFHQYIVAAKGSPFAKEGKFYPGLSRNGIRIICAIQYDPARMFIVWGPQGYCYEKIGYDLSIDPWYAFIAVSLATGDLLHQKRLTKIKIEMPLLETLGPARTFEGSALADALTGEIYGIVQPQDNFAVGARPTALLRPSSSVRIRTLKKHLAVAIENERITVGREMVGILPRFKWLGKAPQKLVTSFLLNRRVLGVDAGKPRPD
tara:strand:- start:5821 stop:6501 length:681 start_codon:yes stop_codon:yes gene_type:complete